MVQEIVEMLRDSVVGSIELDGLNKMSKEDSDKQLGIIIDCVKAEFPEWNLTSEGKVVLIDGISKKFNLGYYRPEAVEARKAELRQSYNDMIEELLSEDTVTKDIIKKAIENYLPEWTEDPKVFASKVRKLTKQFGI